MLRMKFATRRKLYILNRNYLLHVGISLVFFVWRLKLTSSKCCSSTSGPTANLLPASANMEIVLALADVRGLIQALIYRKTQVMLGSVNAACRVHCAFIRMDALSDCRQAYEDHRRHYGKAHRHRALHGGGVDQAMPHATAPPSAAAETEDTGAPPSAVAEPAATAEVQAGLVDGATTAVTEDTEVVDDSPVTDAAPEAPEEEDEAAGTSAASAGAQADAHRELVDGSAGIYVGNWSGRRKKEKCNRHIYADLIVRNPAQILLCLEVDLEFIEALRDPAASRFLDSIPES